MQGSESVAGYRTRAVDGIESAHSAVSWGAIIAGAVIGAALMGMLTAAGSGFGFLAVSPWKNDGASGTTLAVGTILWLLLTHIIAYGIAGYVTGRLRTKWTSIHGDEIYFRDTAHGFIVWALSTLVGFMLLAVTAASALSGVASAGASLIEGGGQAATAAAQASGQGGESSFSMDYFTDALLRPSEPGRGFNTQQDVGPEVTRILMRSAADGQMSDSDKDYLVRLIANRTDMSEAEAQQRLDEITGAAQQAMEDAEQKARHAADEARKAAAKLALWGFAALLLGAFVSSFSATIGGRSRDL